MNADPVLSMSRGPLSPISSPLHAVKLDELSLGIQELHFAVVKSLILFELFLEDSQSGTKDRS